MQIPKEQTPSQQASITLLFSVTVKASQAKAFSEVVEQLARTTRAEDEGCLAYIWLQQQDNPLEYVLFEQWLDQTALDAHLSRLRTLLGSAHLGGRLPQAFLDLFEKTQAVRYHLLT